MPDARAAILDALSTGKARTRVQLQKDVAKRSVDVKRALRSMVESGELTRIGNGTRGDPFRFVVPVGPDSDLVPEEKPEVPTPQKTPAGNPCGSCETEIPPGARFCPSCGIGVDEDQVDVDALKAEVQELREKVAELETPVVPDDPTLPLFPDDDDDDDDDDWF